MDIEVAARPCPRSLLPEALFLLDLADERDNRINLRRVETGDWRHVAE